MPHNSSQAEIEQVYNDLASALENLSHFIKNTLFPVLGVKEHIQQQGSMHSSIAKGSYIARPFRLDEL